MIEIFELMRTMMMMNERTEYSFVPLVSFYIARRQQGERERETHTNREKKRKESAREKHFSLLFFSSSPTLSDGSNSMSIAIDNSFLYGGKATIECERVNMYANDIQSV